MNTIQQNLQGVCSLEALAASRNRDLKATRLAVDISPLWDIYNEILDCIKGAIRENDTQYLAELRDQLEIASQSIDEAYGNTSRRFHVA